MDVSPPPAALWSDSGSLGAESNQSDNLIVVVVYNGWSVSDKWHAEYTCCWDFRPRCHSCTVAKLNSY